MKFAVYYKDDHIEYIEAKDQDEAYQMALDALEVVEDESDDV